MPSLIPSAIAAQTAVGTSSLASPGFDLLVQSGVGGGIAILFFLLFMAVFIGIVVWTYSDAQRHSSHPAFLWAIVVFLAPFLGLVLYVLLGRDRV